MQKYEKGTNRISASRLYYSAKTLGVPVQFFFEDLPGIDGHGALGEASPQDSILAALMNVDGVTLAKAFRDADSSGKRRLIASVARMIADSKE